MDVPSELSDITCSVLVNGTDYTHVLRRSLALHAGSTTTERKSALNAIIASITGFASGWRPDWPIDYRGSQTVTCKCINDHMGSDWKCKNGKCRKKLQGQKCIVLKNETRANRRWKVYNSELSRPDRRIYLQTACVNRWKCSERSQIMISDILLSN